MGGGGSKAIPREDFPASRYGRVTDFLHQQCHLSEHDLNELYYAYCKMCGPRAPRDRVTFEKYCKYLYFEKMGRFLRTMALYFSADQETLTFPEFALLMSFFNTLSENELAEFLYTMITDTNYIATALGDTTSGSSMEHVIKQLFGNAWGNETKIAKILSHMGQGSVTKNAFVKYCVSNRSLLHMPVTHQLALRGKIVSERFWNGRRAVIPVHACVSLRQQLLVLENELEAEQLTTAEM